MAKNVTGIVPVVRSNLSISSIVRKKVVTAGWGQLSGNKTTPFLQKAYLRILTLQQCEHYIFQIFGIKGFMPENLYCTSASKNAMEYPVNLGCVSDYFNTISFILFIYLFFYKWDNQFYIFFFYF